MLNRGELATFLRTRRLRLRPGLSAQATRYKLDLPVSEALS